jgi:hypothetical protein
MDVSTPGNARRSGATPHIVMKPVDLRQYRALAPYLPIRSNDASKTKEVEGVGSISVPGP